MAKETIRITKDKLVREVSKASSMSIAKTKSVFNNIEDVIVGHLLQADENTDVTVRVLDGVSFIAKHQPETQRTFLGNDIVVSQRIKPKAVFSRTFVENINS